MSRVITPAEIRVYKRCREEHRHQYVLKAEPVVTDELLFYSRLLKRALAKLWVSRSLDEALTVFASASPYVRARAEAMVMGYEAYWSRADIEVLAVDEPFRILWEGYILCGRLDAIIRTGGKTFILKHRNTTADANAGSAYRTRLFVDDEIYFHFAGASALGYEVDGFVYDVLKRPLLRPLSATPIGRRRYTKAGRLYANQRDQDESPTAYRHRMVRRLMHEGPEHYHRVAVTRDAKEAAWARRELQWVIRDLLRSQPNVPEPRTVDACERFGRMCPYLDVCARQVSIYDPRYFNHEASDARPLGKSNVPLEHESDLTGNSNREEVMRASS